MKDFSFQGIEEINYQDDLISGSIDNSSDHLLFGRFSHERIVELAEESGIYRRLRSKGYHHLKLKLALKDPLSQHIYFMFSDKIVLHFRLRLHMYSFKRHKNISAAKLIFIDWLQANDIIRKKTVKTRLYPGQEYPGPGIFSSLVNFLKLLVREAKARGAFNIPEYFHDAVLFRKQFYFYFPEVEADMRCLIRDLNHLRMRGITNALNEKKVYNEKNEIYEWRHSEMLSIDDHFLESDIFDEKYHLAVSEYTKKRCFKFIQ